MKQILKAKGAEIPKSDTWHKDLLNLTVSLGIIPAKLSDDLYIFSNIFNQPGAKTLRHEEKTFLWLFFLMSQRDKILVEIKDIRT